MRSNISIKIQTSDYENSRLFVLDIITLFVESHTNTQTIVLVEQRAQ